MLSIDDLTFNSHGMIPAIVVDASAKTVLTLAYMNRESLEISLREGRTCFWSRSRQELWRKGETSGNVQHIVDITADCDRDALLIRVNKEGPACHLGTDSCFNDKVFIGDQPAPFSVKGLYGLLEGRKKDLPEGSYTTYLFQKGLDKILKKVGEECAETIIAAKNGVPTDTVGEVSDLIYHLLVMLAEQGIPLEDVLAELSRRAEKIGNLKQMKQVDKES